MRKTLFLLVGILVVGFLAIKFLGQEQKNVGPLDVSVVDANYHTLPYVRVEIENLQNGYKTEAQNFGFLGIKDLEYIKSSGNEN